ncbi:hypothetical protein ACFLS8_00200 [Chloroflexota bacterium]
MPIVHTNIETGVFTDDANLIASIARMSSTLRDIDLDENESEAKKREGKQISYEHNAEAQKRANKHHRDTVLLVANQLKEYGLQPRENVFMDVYAEKDGVIFIFEIKSVHTDNFKHQTRSAIRQLLEYEYFEVKEKPENEGKRVLRGIVFNRKPPEDIIGFLKAYKFHVFWGDDGKFLGDPSSEEAFKSFCGNT